MRKSKGRIHSVAGRMDSRAVDKTNAGIAVNRVYFHDRRSLSVEDARTLRCLISAAGGRLEAGTRPRIRVLLQVCEKGGEGAGVQRRASASWKKGRFAMSTSFDILWGGVEGSQRKWDW